MLLVVILSSVATVPAVAQTGGNPFVEPGSPENTNNEESTEPEVTNVNHRFQFTNIIVDVKSKSLSQFVVVVENPEQEAQQLIVSGLDGQNSQDVIQLRPQETRRLEITPDQIPNYPIYSFSSIREFIPREEIEGAADVSDASYAIEYQLLDINSEPPVPHNAWIVFLGGLIVILATASGYLINSRNTRLAIPKNRSIKTGIRDSPTYNWSEDDPAVLKLAIFVKDWTKAWGLMVVNAVIAVWGIIRLLGGELHGTYTVDFYFFAVNVVVPRLLENSMVYLMYGQFIFFLPCLIVGIYLARTNWIELSDIDPKLGDNFLYWLTPQRFRDMKVLTEVRKVDNNANRRDDVVTYEAPKNWLYDVNQETRRESYEVVDYDVHENIAYVSWSGELKQLNPSKVRSNQRLISWVFETSIWAIDQWQKLKDFFVAFVQREASYLKARDTAIIEGAQMPEHDGTRQRVEQRLEKQNQAEILEDNQLDKAEKLQEIKPEDEELMDSGVDDGSDLTTRQGGDSDGE
jgi:hypothetical protein